MREHLSIDPSDATVWNDKGYALNKLGRYQEALDAYEKVLSRERNDRSSWYNKGLVLYKLAGIRKQCTPLMKHCQLTRIL